METNNSPFKSGANSTKTAMTTTSSMTMGLSSPKKPSSTTGLKPPTTNGTSPTIKSNGMGMLSSPVKKTNVVASSYRFDEVSRFEKELMFSSRYAKLEHNAGIQVKLQPSPVKAAASTTTVSVTTPTKTTSNGNGSSVQFSDVRKSTDPLHGSSSKPPTTNGTSHKNVNHSNGGGDNHHKE